MFVFPLYVYPTAAVNGGGSGVARDDRITNLSPAFIRRSSERLGQEPDPESLFAYMYALLHSQGYRDRFADQLRVEFPRLPVPPGPGFYRALCELGGRLRDAHLLAPPLPVTPANYSGPESPQVGRVGWSDGNVWLDSPRTKTSTKGSGCFRGVPEVAWNFNIGGYQICHKWLKDRKGRALSSDEVSHYEQVVGAVLETTRLMSRIDTAIDEHGGWADAFRHQ